MGSTAYDAGNGLGSYRAALWTPSQERPHGYVAAETYCDAYHVASCDYKFSTSECSLGASSIWAPQQAPAYGYDCTAQLPRAQTTERGGSLAVGFGDALLSSSERTSNMGHGGLRCLWGGSCRAPLQSAAIPAIRAHLRDAHGVPGRDKMTRIPCIWDGRCCRSSDAILPGGMGKHIATCHLKSMRKLCASCGQAFCRQDSLTRHEMLYCPKLHRGDGRRKRALPANRQALSTVQLEAHSR